MNLVLIGYRGTGKSAVAEILSQRLGMEAVSLDREIVREAGMPIPEIVAKYGWPRFRDLESEITGRFSIRDGLILDTGGGVVLRRENTEKLRQGGVLFWLKASVEVIADRIREGTERPALTNGKSFVEEIEEVLAERLPQYRAAADSEIDTDSLTPSGVAEKIAEQFPTLVTERSSRHE